MTGNKRTTSYEFCANTLDENADIIENYFFDSTEKGIMEFFKFCDQTVKTNNVWPEIVRYRGSESEGTIDRDSATIHYLNDFPAFQLPQDIVGYVIPQAIKARFLKIVKVYNRMEKG